MAKIKEESLRLNIIINGDNARKQMAEYEKVLDDLTKEQKRLKEMRDRLAAAGQTSAVLAEAVPGTENFTRLSKELQATKARMLELKSAGVVICFHLLYLCS